MKTLVLILLLTLASNLVRSQNPIVDSAMLERFTAGVVSSSHYLSDSASKDGWNVNDASLNIFVYKNSNGVPVSFLILTVTNGNQLYRIGYRVVANRTYKGCEEYACKEIKKMDDEEPSNYIVFCKESVGKSVYINTSPNTNGCMIYHKLKLQKE